MKKVLAKSILFSAIALALAFTSCKNNEPKDQPAEQPAANAPDAALVAAAENNISVHQDDIQLLWDLSYGNDRKIANYYLAGNDVLINTEDGKDGYLLYFYKDIKDEGQEVSFQGNAVVFNGFGRTTYFERTENEGFKQLFTVTEKDGKKVFTDEDGKPYDEKEAQAFIDKISTERPAVHSYISSAIGFAENYSDLGNGGLSIGIEDLCPMPDDSIVLLLRTR